jgi:hypothetical protein
MRRNAAAPVEQDTLISGKAIAILKRILFYGFPVAARFMTSVRLGSTNNMSGFDGQDGLLMAEGTQNGILWTDRTTGTKYRLWYSAGGTVFLLTQEAGGNVWAIDPTTGIYTLQTAWTAPTLLNSWVNFGAGFAGAAYCRDHLGFVHIRGVIKSGTQTAGTVLFALPTGFRPLADQMFTVSDTGSFLELRVASGGNVTLGIAAPSNAYLSLDMRFSTA